MGLYGVIWGLYGVVWGFFAPADGAGGTGCFLLNRSVFFLVISAVCNKPDMYGELSSQSIDFFLAISQPFATNLICVRGRIA